MKVIINRNEMLMDKFSMRGLWYIEESKHVKAVMKGIPDHVIHDIDMRRLIIDSGASTHASGSIRDFKINSMKVLKNPIPMDGISGKIFVTHFGTLHFKCKFDNGEEEIIEDKGYYLPSLPCSLFSPQTYIKNVSLNS